MKSGKSEFAGWLIEYRTRRSAKWRHWLSFEGQSQEKAEKIFRYQREIAAIRYLRLCRLVKTPMEEGE